MPAVTPRSADPQRIRREAVLPPAAGEELIFCHAREMNVNIKVSPANTGASYVVGTAKLFKGSNFGTHEGTDETIYFLRGTGTATIGDKVVSVEPGTTLFIPPGVRHGFTNSSDTPLEFLWVISPPGLEERFRSRGRRSVGDCPPASE
jgi:mannose-6-phosphate isomerase-like protein (cupin superfamily)